APVYAFFKSDPVFQHIDGRPCHVFTCAAAHCRNPTNTVRRYLDTKDSNSTSGLRKHAEKCWGAEALKAAQSAADANTVRSSGILASGSFSGAIDKIFERLGKGRVTYSHRAHTKVESRLRPVGIVGDRGFLSIAKTGRPDHYIPSPSTVSRDLKNAFVKCRNRIAKYLQEYDGALSFATDAWTSPNHRAFVAFTVHLEHNGVPLSLLLDFVEVPRSHSGMNLAMEF
ncbi:hypothetical protein DFP72DRAFT_789780, partial [Ephemerocybe angulata]